MRLEIHSAANFLVHLLRLHNNGLTESQLEMFRSSLTDVLRRRYQEHWFPEKPARGSGYRCLRINGKMDPVIAQAGSAVGLPPSYLHSLFPSELTMWIDPAEVSYRIGENGSICVLYEDSNIGQGSEDVGFQRVTKADGTSGSSGTDNIKLRKLLNNKQAMAAGIGGVLLLGAGITLLLASLRTSDGSLLLSSAVKRPTRLQLLGGGSETQRAPPSQQQRRVDPHLSEDEDEVEAAAERWLLYETGGNGIVDLEGIPPPQPHHQHRQHTPPIQQAFMLPLPWNKRDQHPLRPLGSAGEHPGETHLKMAETVPGAGGGGGGGGGGGELPPDFPKDLANQFMLRSPRGTRHYDVPVIECPTSEGNMERFACPTPDRMGRYLCIDDHVLCDGFIDCPSGEDEDRHACMFYKTTKAHLELLADAILRWARGR